MFVCRLTVFPIKKWPLHLGLSVRMVIGNQMILSGQYVYESRMGEKQKKSREYRVFHALRAHNASAKASSP